MLIIFKQENAIQNYSLAMSKLLNTYLAIMIYLVLFASSVALAQDVAGSEEVFGSGAAQGLPELLIKEPIFNFGTVRQGAKVEHIFELQNIGQGPLEISKIYPACGCTAAVIESNKIGPGEKTTIKATFDTSGFQGFKAKTVRVYTNDPKNPAAMISLEGTVQPDIEIVPPRINFGVVHKGNSPSQVVTIKVDSTSEIRIEEIVSRSTYIDIKVEDLPGAADKYKKVTATLKNNLPPGIFREGLVVKTTSEQNPVIPVPVFANIEGDLSFDPSDISIGLIEGPLEEAVSRSVKLINRGNHPIKILSTRSDNPAISAGVKTLEEGKIFEVQVQVKPGSAGTLRARLTLSTDHPDQDQREISLPVYGIISRKGQ